VAVTLASLPLCTEARAQEQRGPDFRERIAAPEKALELKVGAGYTQGFGNLAPGRAMPRVVGAGLGVGVDADYRMNRHWSLGIEGQYQEFGSQDNSGARGLAGNVGATYHFTPVMRGDPWIRIGTGYRMLWETEPGLVPSVTTMRHGFELGAAKVGYDVRLSEDIAIAPVVGADVNLFLWQSVNNGSSSSFTNGQVATVVYSGLQGRFDMGGNRTGTGVTAGTPLPITSAQVPEPTPAPVAATPPPTTPVAPSIAVSEDIRRQCELSIGAIDKAPKFQFDKAELLPEDYAVLDQIATCFSNGPMKGLNMTLVGRADPRGTVEYNQALGAERANAVATYLEGRGVETAQVSTTSRGKLDATGHDEATWAVDRRVDILNR